MKRESNIPVPEKFFEFILKRESLYFIELPLSNASHKKIGALLTVMNRKKMVGLLQE